MAGRIDHIRVLGQLQLMYEDARRSNELRAQEADASQQRLVAARGGYRSAARTRLEAMHTEQAARRRLRAQSEQNLEDMTELAERGDAPTEASPTSI